MKLENPFPEYGYFGPEYFCDREKETEAMVEALKNGSNVTLMAPRRIGKTGLIHHVFQQMKARDKSVQCFYVDVFPTKTFSQMVQFIASAVMGKLDSPSKSLKRKLDKFVAALRPTVTPDPLTGMPTFSFSVEPDNARETLSQVFEYMKESAQQCYLAIDEFQQVSYYSEVGADAYIRSIIQFIPNVHLIFSGSQQHLLAEMFMSPKHPFFNSSQIMTIKEIDREKYAAFANSFFKKQGREMPQEIFDYLYNLVDGQTWYIQKILNRLYRSPKEDLCQAAVNRAVNDILSEQEINYQNNYHLLTENQALLLSAIAHQGIVSAPTALDFIMRYRLPAPSSVRQALKSLQDKEYVYQTPNGDYLVYDRFFALWLRRLQG